MEKVLDTCSGQLTMLMQGDTMHCKHCAGGICGIIGGLSDAVHKHARPSLTRQPDRERETIFDFYVWCAVTLRSLASLQKRASAGHMAWHSSREPRSQSN